MGGGQVGADDREVGEPVQSPPVAAGSSLLDLDRADVALGLVAGEPDREVGGEASAWPATLRRVLLDEVMPDFQFHEIHAVAVKANGAQVFAALEAVTPSELPAFRILMGLRSLPAFAVRRRPAFGFGSASLLEQAKHAGFLVLGEETDRELVLGMVGQPWRLLGARMPASLHSAADFVSYREPGFAKMATNFRFELPGSPEQESRLVTETRVWLPDPPTARRFGAYWVLIRAGSGLIRREWLSRIKARAEAAAG